MTEMYKYKAYHEHGLRLNCRGRFSRLIRVFTDNLSTKLALTHLSDTVPLLKSCHTNNKSPVTVRWANVTNDNISIFKLIMFAHPTG